MQTFAYARPTTLDDALGLLVDGGPGARPMAGGTDLLIRLRDRSLTAGLVIDVKDIPELGPRIERAGGRLVIGATTTMTAIAADPLVRSRFTALAEAASVVGSVQIRNRASLAGNLCNASPAADTAPALLVYGATLVVLGPAGSRRVPVDDFFVTSGHTTLRPGELLGSIELPIDDGPLGSAHVRRTRRRGHDLAAVTLACSVRADGTVRLAYGSVGPRPVLAPAGDAILADPDADPDLRAAAIDRLFVAARPSLTSMRAGPDYRLAMLRVLGRRALDAAAGRSAGAVA